jgi:hypothetical protein
MAITNKFVTSFSELYIGDATTQALVSNPSDTVVRNFFAPTATTITLGTAVAIVSGAFYKVVDPATGLGVYWKATASVSSAAYATIAAVDALTELSFFSAQVPLVAEIGTLSNEATVIDTPEFGKKFKGKLRGQLDGGQLDSSIYWAPRDFMHIKLREFAENGCPTISGIKWQPSTEDCGGGASTDSELVIFSSFVSSFSIDTAFDDVAKAAVTMIVDGEESFAAGA